MINFGLHRVTKIERRFCAARGTYWIDLVVHFLDSANKEVIQEIVLYAHSDPSQLTIHEHKDSDHVQ